MTTYKMQMTPEAYETLERNLKRASYDALITVLEAADKYCSYLESVGYESEVPPIRNAVDLLRGAAVEPQ